jgi:hypothetical protein
MQDNYEKLFSHSRSPHLPGGLFDSIVTGVRRERRTQVLKKRVILFSLGVIISLVALVPAFSFLREGMARSGTLYFLSLVFSDPGVVLGLWQEFIFSLLETLPIVSMAVFLAALFVFFGSIRLFIRDAAALFISPRVVHH